MPRCSRPWSARPTTPHRSCSHRPAVRERHWRHSTRSRPRFRARRTSGVARTNPRVPADALRHRSTPRQCCRGSGAPDPPAVACRPSPQVGRPSRPPGRIHEASAGNSNRLGAGTNVPIEPGLEIAPARRREARGRAIDETAAGCELRRLQAASAEIHSSNVRRRRHTHSRRTRLRVESYQPRRRRMAELVERAERSTPGVPLERRTGARTGDRACARPRIRRAGMASATLGAQLDHGQTIPALSPSSSARAPAPGSQSCATRRAPLDRRTRRPELRRSCRCVGSQRSDPPRS